MWMEWSECIQVQCGVVNRTRSRSCDSPPPSLGGSYCVGAVEETESCVNTSCPSGERMLINYTVRKEILFSI